MAALSNARHEAFARAVVGGSRPQVAARTAGFAGKRAKQQASRLLARRDVLSRIKELQDELTTLTLVDAAQLHRDLSEMWRADIADIIELKTGCYKPVHEWPPIWRRMLSRLDVRELYERSKDGKSNRWDKVGEIVKIRFVEMTRLGELLARHKAVPAFVAQKIEGSLEMQMRADGIMRRLLAGRERLRLEEAADGRNAPAKLNGETP